MEKERCDSCEDKQREKRGPNARKWSPGGRGRPDLVQLKRLATQIDWSLPGDVIAKSLGISHSLLARVELLAIEQGIRTTP